MKKPPSPPHFESLPVKFRIPSLNVCIIYTHDLHSIAITLTKTLRVHFWLVYEPATRLLDRRAVSRSFQNTFQRLRTVSAYTLANLDATTATSHPNHK